MLINFDSLPANARVWIFQANRVLSNAETELLHKNLSHFCETWEAHGRPLKASFKMWHNLFVILAVDTVHHDTSGCSIDASTRALKEAGMLVNADFFDRSKVAFWINNGIHFVALHDLKEKYKDGMWSGQTITFNTLANTKAMILDGFETEAEKTWLKRYIIPAEKILAE